MRDRRTDAVTCGTGPDRVRAEVLDALDVACERVDYGPAGRVGSLRPVTGGGRFVPVPGQPWARVDRRILRNVLYLVRRYHVRIGDGFAMRGHERHGEHPLGLAVDLFPGPGGSWARIAQLARWAEPRQDRPRWPFRWGGMERRPQPRLGRPPPSLLGALAGTPRTAGQDRLGLAGPALTGSAAVAGRCTSLRRPCLLPVPPQS